MTKLNEIELKIMIVGELDKLKETDLEKYNEYLPAYTDDGNAAFDVRAAITEPLTLKPNEFKLVPTGLKIWLKDPNFVGFVMPRSGRGSKGLILGNSTGVIDSNYQGELGLCLWNRTDVDTVIQPWERVAQYMIIPKYKGLINIVDSFEEETERGDTGFGKSGTV